MKQRDDWHLTGDIEHESGRGDPFAAAIRATRMPMVITDPRLPDNPIVFANEAFQNLTGYGREEIIGRNCRFLQGPETDEGAVATLREAIAGENAVQIDILNYRKDGSKFWNALYLSPTRGVDGDVQFFFASQLDVTDRIEAQRQITEQKEIVEVEVQKRTLALKEALQAKTLLLHEVDHRVKNNLTMIGSLLRLQSRQIGDPAISSKLDAMLERVDALATVHRRLYQSDDITRFDVGAFTANLVADVIGASGRTDIKVDADVEELEIPSSKASALGLIINELVTNAVKHAFANGRSGTLHVFARAIDGRAILRISDDGLGMPKADTLVDGLGRTLVARLSRQVGGTTSWHGATSGTTVTIDLPAGG
ncbi:histidine kinase dimerization/phosphoacceptor domain -containing protein [Lichenifustis flavocetrariae]|uniref:PAS domain-containing protein n=1 Tax=Lichenifustis flavocetrariae TaxID=2949735 RepID=A0AA41YY11_9HYPH|nr:histidine kinase dimerization/phosphoacceptor domain -containing protein [Lichenifustis flavocetrariae]MCW6506925.1 PAS domain-containing protein [Lichenifustis flavocetrariae]